MLMTITLPNWGFPKMDEFKLGTLPVFGGKSSLQKKECIFYVIVMVMINNIGNRTLCRPIQSVIILEIKQIGQLR